VSDSPDQFFTSILLIILGLLGAGTENPGSILQKLAFPVADQGGVHLVLGSQLGQMLLTLDVF